MKIIELDCRLFWHQKVKLTDRLRNTLTYNFVCSKVNVARGIISNGSSRDQIDFFATGLVDRSHCHWSMSVWIIFVENYNSFCFLIKELLLNS